MPYTYVNAPGTGSGVPGDPYRADIDTDAVDSVEGNRLAGSGRFVVRVEGPQSALDALVARGPVEELNESDFVAELNAGAPCTIDSNSRLLRADETDG